MKFSLSLLVLYEAASILEEPLFLPFLSFKNDFHKAQCHIFKNNLTSNLLFLDVIYA